MLASLITGRCPWCGRGKIFRGVLAMNQACPSCGVVFEKEPGYFVGAMYFSYFLAVPAYALLAWLALRWLGGRSQLLAFTVAFVAFVPLAPMFFRASRIMWLYLDCIVQKKLR